MCSSDLEVLVSWYIYDLPDESIIVPVHSCQEVSVFWYIYDLPDESIIVPVHLSQEVLVSWYIYDLPDESIIVPVHPGQEVQVPCYNSLTSLMSPSLSLSTLVRMSASLFLLSSGVKCLNSSASDPRKAWGSANFSKN